MHTHKIPAKLKSSGYLPKNNFQIISLKSTTIVFFWKNRGNIQNKMRIPGQRCFILGAKITTVMVSAPEVFGEVLAAGSDDCTSVDRTVGVLSSAADNTM